MTIAIAGGAPGDILGRSTPTQNSRPTFRKLLSALILALGIYMLVRGFRMRSA